ncbi:hypothetical protein Lser_V15G41268 [Lactuca serriola]
MTRKSNSLTPPHSDNDDGEEEESRKESPRVNTPPRSPTPIADDKIPTPPPSPKQTPPTPTPKVPVSVVPTSTIETSLPPPPVSSVSIRITPFSNPIITPVTTTTLPEQTARVNVSDTGTLTGTEAPVISKTLSPIHSTEFGNTLGGDNDEYDSTYFSPYRLQSDEDTDAPVNQQHLHSIHEKLDQLLADTKTYGGVVLKAFLETAIEQYT